MVLAGRTLFKSGTLHSIYVNIQNNLIGDAADEKSVLCPALRVGHHSVWIGREGPRPSSRASPQSICGRLNFLCQIGGHYEHPSTF